MDTWMDTWMDILRQGKTKRFDWMDIWMDKMQFIFPVIVYKTCLSHSPFYLFLNY